MEFGTDLKDLQEAVGGNIEVIYPFEEPVGLVMNEEGKVDGLPLNRSLRDEHGDIFDLIAGPFMVVGLTEESFGSLSPEQIQKFSEMFHQPEMFVKMGMGVKAIPLPDEMVEKQEKAVEKAPAKEPQKKEPTAKRRKTPDHNDR